MSEENGNQKDAPPPGQVHLNAQVTPQGMVLSCAYPMTLGLNDEMMDQLTEQWIMQRPQLLQKIAQKAVEVKKQELAIIKHFNSTGRNN